MVTFKYKDFVAAMKELAERHKEILHGQNVAGVVRNSFFRTNNEEELRQSLSGDDDVHYPYMMLTRPYYKYEQSGNVNRRMFVGFEIRTIVESANDPDGIDDARDMCQRIAEEVLGYINLQAEEEVNGSPFYAFDVATVQGDVTGPVHESEYGFRVMWSNKEGAWNPFAYDETEFFNPS